MQPFYEASARIPLIIVPPRRETRVEIGVEDDRFAEFGDIMPTLLDLANIPIPNHVDQLSLIGDEEREYIYGEHGEDEQAQRMVRHGRYKMIYYPVGNQTQLFDIENDPREIHNLAGDPVYAAELAALTSLLLENLYGSDLDWVRNGKLVGLPDREFQPGPIQYRCGQRGIRFY